MKNRYEKVVYKDVSGKIFELYKPQNKTLFIFDGEDGELIIKAVEEEYFENYKNPPIPFGYKHVMGEWDTGFVIERTYDQSQFTWVPVGYLDSDGSFDGINFTEKFGTRNIACKEGDGHYFEVINEEFIDQLESVRKYGGFYISTYAISEDEDGILQSKKGAYPLTGITKERACYRAPEFSEEWGVTSHLPFGSEYDCIIAWLHKSKDVTLSDVTINSKDWGNYKSFEVKPAGSYELWCNKNIYDFFGNVEELTQEQYIDSDGYTGYSVIRGGSAFDEKPVACRNAVSVSEEDLDVGFRIALCILPNAEVTYIEENS